MHIDFRVVRPSWAIALIFSILFLCQGKSLSTIALLHTVMTTNPPLIRTALLVVPVNTIANWDNGT